MNYRNQQAREQFFYRKLIVFSFHARQANQIKYLDLDSVTELPNARSGWVEIEKSEDKRFWILFPARGLSAESMTCAWHGTTEA